MIERGAKRHSVSLAAVQVLLAAMRTGTAEWPSLATASSAACRGGREPHSKRAPPTCNKAINIQNHNRADDGAD